MNTSLPFLLVVPWLLPLPAGAQDPALRGVPKGAANVLVVRDPMPHVEALLNSAPVRDVAAATADLQQQWLGMRLDPSTLERQLALVRSFVPTRIEAAFTDDLLTSAAHLLHAAAHGVVAEARAPEGDEQKRMREEVTAALRAVRPPTGIVRIAARDERIAEQWFDSLLELCESLPAEVGTVDVGDEHLDLRLRPFALLPRLPSIAPLVDRSAVADFELQARVEQRGNVMSVQFGSFEPADLGAADLGELWRASDDQLVFGAIDAEAALDVAFGTYEMLSACVEELEAPEVMRMSSAVDRITDLSPRTWVALDLDGGVRGTTLEDLGKADDPDSGVGIDEPAPEVVRCIDPATGPVTLSSLTLDLVLAGALDVIVSRLMQRPERFGGERLPARIDAFDDLFEFIKGEESAVFEPGFAFVCGGAAVRSLRFRLADGSPAEFEQMPFVSCAVVAKAQDAEAARAFVDTLVELTLKGFGAAGEDALVDADLGLGVPTRRLAFRGFLPEDVQLDADFDPHHAQHGDVMILSTDSALTKRLLQRLRAEDAPKLPVANPVEWQSWSGDHVAALLDGLARWAAAVPEQAAGEEVEMLARVLAALQPLARAIDRAESLMVIENGRWLRSTWTLQLR